MNKYFKNILFLALVTPLFTFAYFSELKIIILSVGDLVKLLTTLVAGVALLVFFYGLVKFIMTTSSTGKTDGKKFMIWGIVALFVMVSVGGIIAFMQSELGLPVTPFFTGSSVNQNNNNNNNPGNSDPGCDSFSDDPSVQPCL